MQVSAFLKSKFFLFYSYGHFNSIHDAEPFNVVYNLAYDNSAPDGENFNN